VRVHAALRVGAIIARGFTGASARGVNGVYDPVGLYEGKVLFQQREDPDKWARWVKTRGFWTVSSTADKDAHSDIAGWCHCEERDVDDPRHASLWSVCGQDEKWAVQAGAKVVAFTPAKTTRRAAANGTSTHAGGSAHSDGVQPNIASRQGEAAAATPSGWVTRPAE
jgi:hypothetical protein